MGDEKLISREYAQWRQQLQERMQEAARKKAATARERAERRRRRENGLLARHAAKLARSHPEHGLFPPDPWCSER